MTRRANCNSRVAVEEDVPINIFYPHATGALGNQFEFRAGIRWIYKLGIRRNDFLAFGPWQCCLDLWPLRWC
jgi:hypothetical protein